MAKLTFGNTWWGKEWLNSLTHIDNSNRLPRGLSYARNGYVKDIEIEKNKVHAKVKGSRPSPYKIVINLKEFSNTEKDKIKDIILGDQFLLSSLLSQTIPQSLYAILKENDIDIFPKNWRDLKGLCSCPDYANPCKHLASVIYMIANEIDRDPFLIFKLHNFNIEEIIKNTGIETKENIITIDSIFEEETKQNNNNCSNLDFLNIDNIDFSVIPNLYSTISSLLTPNPLFYLNDDFKVIIKNFYQKIAKESYKIQNNAIIDNEKYQFPEEFRFSNITVDKNLDITDSQIYSNFDIVEFDERNLNNLFVFLNSIHYSKIKFLDNKIIIYYLLYNFTLKLL